VERACQQVLFKSRWSELANSVDLIALNTEMVLCSSISSSFPSPDQKSGSNRQHGGGINSSNVLKKKSGSRTVIH
jgi:hypothetical protein